MNFQQFLHLFTLYSNNISDLILQCLSQFALSDLPVSALVKMEKPPGAEGLGGFTPYSNSMALVWNWIGMSVCLSEFA